MKSGLCVGELMTHKPVSIPGSVSVQDAARIMSEKSVGSLLVVEENELLGILVRADIIREVVAYGKDASSVLVEDVMTQEVLVISPEKDVLDALRFMAEHDIRTLPVLQGEELVGFITAKDILKVNPELFELLSETYVLREEKRKLRLSPFEPENL
ncbi:MAG: cyclic nucleotide-binding/CBS domain-containing protein [Candidatus Woesearchaeota archaeon]